MRKFIGILTCSLAIFAAAAVQAVAQHPSWAYGFVDPPPAAGAPAAPAAPAGGGGGGGAAAPAPVDNTPLTVPGSDRKYTRQQANNAYGPADWFPNEHPTPPPIVTNGRMDAMINACGLCHYVGGHGRQENAGLAGLPYDYFVQTLMDFKNDNRHSADPRKANTNRMVGFAKAMTDEEIKAAAKYYSSIPWTQYIRVVESNTVPKTRGENGMFVKLPGNETEPLGMRIIESPEDFDRTSIRDPHSGFVAYVPVGSIKKGETLVRTGGNGKTVQCAFCHGPTLEGRGPVPGIAGRSPSYLGRQLYDMQAGTRKGVWTELMKPVVEKLTAEDMIDIIAYVSSRPIGTPARQTAVR
jgi:cytochrome c553